MRFRCRSRRCPSCGLLWAGDARRKLLVNIAEYGGDVTLVTQTAPGADRLPDARAMTEWNESAPRRWRRLHTLARTAAVRQGHVVTIVARTWEYQKRGALHVHVVVGVHTAAELAGAHAYVRHLHRLRSGQDFGFVDRHLRRATAEVAARYVAKYLAPIRGGKLTLSETVLRHDVPPHVMHVSRDLTRRTGVTMRSLRWRRRCHMAGVCPDTGETYSSIGERAAAGEPDAVQRLVKLASAPPDL